MVTSKDIQKASQLLEAGKTEELFVHVDAMIEKDSQFEFEKYMDKQSVFSESPFQRDLRPIYYGRLQGKQVFTNGHSIYIMEKSFEDNSLRIGRRQKSSPKWGLEYDVKFWLGALEEEMGVEIGSFIENSEQVHVDPAKINHETKDVTLYSSVNEGIFNHGYIMQMYKILGYDTSLLLSNTADAVMGNSKTGKAFILGKTPVSHNPFTKNQK